MKLQVEDIYTSASRLVGADHQAAATLVLAEVLCRLPAQTFDVRAELSAEGKGLVLNLGCDPRLQDPVQVAVLER